MTRRCLNELLRCCNRNNSHRQTIQSAAFTEVMKYSACNPTQDVDSPCLLSLWFAAREKWLQTIQTPSGPRLSRLMKYLSMSLKFYLLENNLWSNKKWAFPCTWPGLIPRHLIRGKDGVTEVQTEAKCHQFQTAERRWERKSITRWSQPVGGNITPVSLFSHKTRML